MSTSIIEISSSKILDCFILEDESPTLILNYIQKELQDENKHIFQSLYLSRIFSYDFVLKCNCDEVKKLLYVMSQITNEINRKMFGFEIEYAKYLKSCILYCCWQVLNSSCENMCSVQIKSLVRNWLKNSGLLDNSTDAFFQTLNISHPYKSKSNLFKFDNKLLELINTNSNTFSENVVQALKYFNNDDCLNMFKTHFNTSIFKFRIYQSDVFESLSMPKQYTWLHYILSTGKNDNTYFVEISTLLLQLLDSKTLINEIKMYLLKNIHKYARIDFYKNDEFLFNNNESFSSFLFHNALDANVNSVTFLSLMIQCITFRYYEILHDWIEYDRESFDSTLNISDVIIQLQTHK